ncbi:rod shape-determining protein [Candidatus Uhrbacteria bacterium RIFCSPHIGHO2_12_FULL_54_23]|uniref:Cell shape-determining protein MreB n=1 Tax=Candidatus Uhrbacteria bacterium RIFCSPHIGHO2_12_FULL_54_23 TaxID=1802397 RepID=A0A1F7UKW6_9BACT|nr:MAG: rod shape-determining protein [Candidatus Uhrbacteria bacterium RIFCSPHIGHO2_12_FULL_54_23]
MLNKIFGTFSRDIGIDLGTANTLVYVREKGIVINEPSVVAMNTRTNQIVAVGDEAKSMIGKTPPHIVATRPLVDGIISDFEATERMLRYFIDKVHQDGFSVVPRPVVVIGIPLEVTEVEKKAVEDAALSAGARKVYLVEQPMAAAIGARLPITEAAGNMVVDIGGGTTQIAVISLAGVVNWRSLRIAGDELTSDIVQYVRDNFNVLIGDKTAEAVKIGIGSATSLAEELALTVRGRDLLTGLPKEILLQETDVRNAMARTIHLIVENIKATIELTPPELVADIYERGIALTGGGALIRGLPQLIQAQTGVKTIVVDDPMTCVVRGTGMVLERLDDYRNILVPLTTE